MCLSTEKPALLLETKFEKRKIQDVMKEADLVNEETKTDLAAQISDNATGAIDGKATGEGELA